MIISARPQGLCNRIKCLLSAMRIAERTGDEVAVYWPQTWEVRCPFGAIFENDIEIDGMTMQTKRLWSRVLGPRTSGVKILDTASLAYFDDDGIAADACDPYVACQPERWLDDMYNGTPASVRWAYLDLIEQLQLRPALTDVADRFAEQFDDDTFSVVIRSWSELADHRRKSHFLHLDFKLAPFLEEIERRNGRFYLTSDSQTVIDEVRSRFPDRAIVRELHSNHGYPDSAQQILDAVINMLIAARGHGMVLSRNSTYAEMAWWFGGAETPVVRPEPPLQKYDPRPAWRRKVLGSIFPDLARNDRCGRVRPELMPTSAPARRDASH